MKEVAVIGHFNFGENCYNGQTIKTKIVTDELDKQLGNNEVLKFDTAGGFKSLFKAPFLCRTALKSAKNIIIFPAHNGVRVYSPLLMFFKKFFKERKLYYVVIGGWLPKFIAKKRILSSILKKFDKIYVETTVMQISLEKMGFKNIEIMQNCKELTILSEKELQYFHQPPFKLCTFSRVNKMKGIEDAVNVINAINKEKGEVIYALDIYGMVDKGQEQWFENLKKSFSKNVKYCGAIPPEKSVEVLKNYFALIFPTHYFTEGIPGTIIDAFSSGLPVIYSKWQSANDILDKTTGIEYEFDNIDQFKKVLIEVLENPKIINDKRKNCIEKANNYIPCSAVKILVDEIRKI